MAACLPPLACSFEAEDMKRERRIRKAGKPPQSPVSLKARETRLWLGMMVEVQGWPLTCEQL